jgi:hypothetical protein
MKQIKPTKESLLICIYMWLNGEAWFLIIVFTHLPYTSFNKCFIDVDLKLLYLSDCSVFVYRTCIPAEAEPTLNSSSCYPLVNFTRPSCQNRGITLPNYVYNTPDYQNNRNDQANADYDTSQKLGASKISRFLKVDISTVRKCMQASTILYCHHYYPSCDRTQNVYKYRIQTEEGGCKLDKS